MSDYIGTASYSPEDNKLRLHPFDYLEPATLSRVKDAGFKWAPVQKLFVAPMWTPDREDLLIELCGEIGDEDTSLVDRAEQRADRFEDYSDKRLNEAEQTRAHVELLLGNHPQPTTQRSISHATTTHTGNFLAESGQEIASARMLDMDGSEGRTRLRTSPLPSEGVGDPSSSLDANSLRSRANVSLPQVRQPALLQPGSPFPRNLQGQRAGHGEERASSEEQNKVSSERGQASLTHEAGSGGEGRAERLCHSHGTASNGNQSETQERRNNASPGHSLRSDEGRNSFHCSPKDLAASPIIIGHHSQRKAEKDAKRIKDGMRRAVQLWETAQYWTDRAKAAIRHAKYKERPEVRHRRIKSLTADLRRKQKTIAEAQSALRLWNNPEKEMTRERAMAISNYGHNFSFKFRLADYPREASASQYEGDMSLWSALSGNVINAEQAKALAVRSFESQIAWATRWANHYENRIAYEGAMLDDQGGIKGEQFDLKPGGQVLVGGEWVTIVRVNMKEGFPVSVSTNARYCRVKGIELIKDYRPPTEEAAEKVEQATKLAPLVNYPGEGFLHITKDQWKRRWNDGKGTETRAANENHGKHRQRYFYGNVNGKQWGTAFVFITDEKVKEPPKPTTQMEPEISTMDLPVETDMPSFMAQIERQKAYREMQEQQAEESKPFTDLKESLKTGVQVVATPQLFPTPPEIAAQMVELADIEPGQRRLEPSAGTGNLITAMSDIAGPIVAVEVSPKLADSLKRRFDDGSVTVHCGDFLEQNGNLGKFDRVIMNPPFERGIDIQHIKHALNFLKPGGKLVALCANGPRQREALQPLASKWEDLPAGSFSSQGTGVNVALLVIEKPDLALWDASNL